MHNLIQFLLVKLVKFFGKVGPKNQNCWFKLKVGTYTNSEMKSSMVLYTFAVLDRKHPFWANLVQKENCQFSLKLGK